VARCRVRKWGRLWFVEEFTGQRWVLVYEFPTWWQAMLEVTDELPYGSETEWTPALRPMWVRQA